MTLRPDARPFVAHHLRRRGDARLDTNGADIHLLARWVENLPSGDPRMARIEASRALGLQDGSLEVGPEAAALVDRWDGGTTEPDRELWLEQFSLEIASWDTDRS